MSRGCNFCTVKVHDELDHKSCKGHHQPDCPEMLWPDGHRRGTSHPEEVARYGRLGSAMTLQDELASIFKSKSEEVPTDARER